VKGYGAPRLSAGVWRQSTHAHNAVLRARVVDAMIKAPAPQGADKLGLGIGLGLRLGLGLGLGSAARLGFGTAVRAARVVHREGQARRGVQVLRRRCLGHAARGQLLAQVHCLFSS